MTQILLICLCVVLAPIASWAEGSSEHSPSLRLNDISTKEDTSVIIKKGAQNFEREFEIVSGEGEIMGDPKSGLQESYASWKEACQNWKKETKELNTDNTVLVLNCNTPQSEKQAGGVQTVTHSLGTYKLKVRIRSEPGHHKGD